MGRAMTPQELAEFNERRRKNLEETASKLGFKPEQLEELERRARQDHASRLKASKEETEEALREAMSLVDSGATLPTPDCTGEPDDMSVEKFAQFLAGQIIILDEEERTAAAKVIARKIACWRGCDDEPLSLREEILLELQSMIMRHNYYAGK